MRFVTLVLFFTACGGSNSDGAGPKGSGEEGSSTDHATSDPGDPTTWSLEVDVNTSGEWIVGLPATVYRSGSNTVFMRGIVGEPMTTGEGSYRIMVGPYSYQSDPAHPYYDATAEMTGDGYPLIVVDYQRYTHGVTQATVDQTAEEKLVDLYPVVGEGYYNIELHEYDYDARASDFKGHDNGTSYLGTSWIALREVSQIVPVTDRNFGDVFHDGDSLTWDGANFTFTLQEETARVVDTWREGRGNNDFGYTYVDPTRNVVTEVSCLYDWSAWYDTF